MNTGRFVLSQVLDMVRRQTLDRFVRRYDAKSRVRHFGCRQQLICMVFAQLTWRESLRDIEACLNAKTETLYHLGFAKPIARSTLSEANESRDWRLWRDLAMGLVAKARRLYADEDLGLELSQAVYAQVGRLPLYQVRDQGSYLTRFAHKRLKYAIPPWLPHYENEHGPLVANVRQDV